jgi:hypothetical protein
MQHPVHFIKHPLPSAAAVPVAAAAAPPPPPAAPTAVAAAGLQGVINEVQKLAQRVKAKLEGLDKTNEAMLKQKGQGPGSASERTRTTITAGGRDAMLQGLLTV